MTPTFTAAPGTIVIFSDLACPFTHVTVHRLFEARRALNLDDTVRFDHHAFPIELLNRAPGTRHGSDSEIPALGALALSAGWQLWQAPDYHYPSTMLLPFEAVAAAKAQGLRASENLDRALRIAFWARSRPIHLHHEILDIAATVEGLDPEALDAALRTGTHRGDVFADFDIATTDTVTTSPHVFLPDGTNVANPGITVRWEGEWAKGFPVISDDEPDTVTTLLQRAADSP